MTFALAIHSPPTRTLEFGSIPKEFPREPVPVTTLTAPGFELME